jgi:hypothetical protein
MALIYLVATTALADQLQSTLSRQFYREVAFDSNWFNMPKSGPVPPTCKRSTFFVGSGGAISAHCISAAHRYCQNVGTIQNKPLDFENAVGIIQEVNINAFNGVGSMGIVCIIPENTKD